MAMHFQVTAVFFVTIFSVIVARVRANILSTDEVTTEEVNDIKMFKSSLINEMKFLKSHCMNLEEKMKELQLKNEEKSKRIEKLESRLETMESEGLRSRRQVGSNVAFTVYSDHGVHNLSHDQPIIYNKVLLNDGGAYNTRTGMFTAPITGIYLFSYSVGAKSLPNDPLSQYDVFTRLVINDVHQLSAVAESTATWDDEQGSTTAILFVEEGSKVWTKHELRGGNNLYSTDDERVTSFTGTLLYQKESQTVSSIIG